MREQVSKEIGKGMVVIGLAMASATITYIIQSETTITRVEALERHAESLHPHMDYRDLVRGQIDALRHDIERLERFNHTP